MDDALFVPDIPSTYDGPIVDPGIELLAFTIREDEISGAQYLAAVRNVSTGLVLCSLDMTTTFFDAGGLELGSSRGIVDVPPHRGVDGTGDLLNCLSPGQTGVQAATLDLGFGVGIAEIASATWQISAINLVDAVPTTDLEVTGVTAVPADFGGNRFTGQLVNHARGSIVDPNVAIYGLNPVGRPLFESSDIELITISSSSSWTFETSPSFDEPFVDTAAFASAREP